jgi:hypothetical protein
MSTKLLMGTEKSPVLIIPLGKQKGFVSVRASKPTCCVKCGGEFLLEHRLIWMYKLDFKFTHNHSAFNLKLECSVCGFVVYFDDGLYNSIGWAMFAHADKEFFRDDY